MVKTRKNTYHAMEKDEVPTNLDQLKATFNELNNVGTEATIFAWQETMQNNMTFVVAYIDKNETNISRINHELRELQDELRLQISHTAEDCTDQVNGTERFQDLIRRKELSELGERMNGKIAPLGRQLNESAKGVCANHADSFFEKISTELDQQDLEGIFQSEDQKSIFMRACYGIVNGLYKREWKKHVAEEVRNNLRANQFALADDLGMTKAHSNQTRQGLDEANEKVVHLHEELSELKQQNEILEKEIERVQRLEHLKAEQVKALRQQIEAIERNQQIQTKEIDIVSRESTFLRDKMSIFKQAKNTDPLKKSTTIPNTHRSKRAVVQFQENIGYLRASSRIRSLSPIGFLNLRNGQIPDNTK